MSYRTYNGNCNGAVLLLLSMVMIMIISCVLFSSVSSTDDKHSIHNHSNDIPSISVAIRGTESNRILKEQKHCGLLSLRKYKGASACELSGQFCVYKSAENMVMNNHGVGGGGTGSGSNYNAYGAQCKGMNRKQCKKCEACSWSKNGSTNICVHSALGGGVDNSSLISQHFKDSMSCTGMKMKGCKESNACSWFQGTCVHGNVGNGNDSYRQILSGMSCSQMNKRDCKLSKNCKYNKGKNGFPSSCINRGARNNGASPARGKRTAVTGYVDQEESSTESITDRLSTSYDIIGTEMDDVFGWSEDDDDTPAEDFETQEVEEERPLKFWSRPMLSGSVCIHSNTYPETYINAVGHLLLFDTKEECCNVYDCRSQEEEEDVGMANSISADEDKP